MAIKIIRDFITREELQKLANEGFGDMVKAVIDTKKGIVPGQNGRGFYRI